MLVLERRMTYGGATITEEVTRPGFYHNLHANFVWSYGLPHQDFELHRDGLRLMHGEVERCYLFGTEPHSPPTPTTHTGPTRQFAGILPKSDLDTLEDVYHRFLIKVEEKFTPRRSRQAEWVGLGEDDRKEYQRLCEMTGREVLDTLYESDKLKTGAAVMNACVRGMPDFAPGTGDFFLRYAASPRLSIVRGGSPARSRTLWRPSSMPMAA